MGRIDQDLHQHIFNRRKNLFSKYPSLKEVYMQDPTAHSYIEAGILSGLDDDKIINKLLVALVAEKKKYFDDYLHLTNLKMPDPLKYKNGRLVLLDE